ncbi:HNH endonuclease [Rhodococcus qingshengii]|uniref:HNH endonuclease n=1 Tax=Rhodococcus qingshengii TaxID=334542 RepID=UPI0024BA5B5F|nr:HNH endonuclease [Rhodococcus qingshengii]MDJ0489126.1 HNH endonuclease [Rhodococcus qingshengii]
MTGVDVEHTKALEAAATPVRDFPGYEVDRQGAVWSCVHNWRGYGRRQITPTTDTYGYAKVRLSINGKRTKVPVARLVAEAFHGLRPTPDHQICHVDGNKLNNRAENLRWGTAKENAADRDSHGTTARGERDGFAKLTDSKVKEIRRLTADGVPGARIAPLMGVDKATIYRIQRGEGWTHVA